MYCSIASSYSLLASRTEQKLELGVGLECREKRRVGSFVAERILHKVESLYIVVHSNVEAGPMQRFFSREAEIIYSLSEQDILSCC